MADAGDHLIDALLWSTGQKGQEVAAIQSHREPVIDLVTVATIRLTNGTPVALAVSGISSGACFALTYDGQNARLHATDLSLEQEQAGMVHRLAVALPVPRKQSTGTLSMRF